MIKTAQTAQRNHQSDETMNELHALNVHFIRNFATDPARKIFAIIQIWRTRARDRRELAARSDRELQDMATCWSSIAHEVSKPFWRP